VTAFERGLIAGRSELSTHALLLFHGTLGHLEFSRSEYQSALNHYRHAFELIRNMQIDGVRDQALQAFAKGAIGIPRDHLTRSDELLWYLHLHLGVTLACLGERDRSDVYKQALLEQRVQLGDHVTTQVNAAFDKMPSAMSGRRPYPERVRVDEGLLDECKALIVQEPEIDSVWKALARRLAAGRPVAILAERIVAGGTQVRDSVVLYGANKPQLASSIATEIGGSHIQRATAAFVLVSAAEMFEGFAAKPLVQQLVTLRSPFRQKCGGLVCAGLNVQLLDDRLDGPLYDVLHEYAALTGIPVLAVAPFHLWRRDLVTTARDAIYSFAVSSIDTLCVNGKLFVKKHGAIAPENVQPFRPRLSEEALVLRADDGALIVRILRRGGYATDTMLKLNGHCETLLKQFDGSNSVADIVAAGSRVGSDRAKALLNVSTFVRDLWTNGALCLDPPSSSRSEPEAV
jgi:hypothetical protein